MTKAEEHLIVLAERSGAHKMLDSLIAVGAIYLDIPNQAIRVGQPVGIELLDKELASRGITR